VTWNDHRLVCTQALMNAYKGHCKLVVYTYIMFCCVEPTLWY